MPVSCALRRRLLITLLVLGAGGLSGCGDDAAGPATADTGAAGTEWSAPVVADGTDSPDGPRDGVRSADELVADLRSRIASGQGHADASYQQSVEDVAAVLWDTSTFAGLRAGIEASSAHQKVAAIAGDVSRWLAATPSARAERSQSHPTDVAIHDAFLASSAQGAQAYRLWCGQEALHLLEQHREAVYRKLMPDTVRQPRADGPNEKDPRAGR